MLTLEQSETLTRVGPGTGMGNLMRRYWVPAVLSWELADADSEPLMVRLLGEDLVAFRQTDGRVGLIGARCAHRRAHLFYGRNEENGLRCVYHGWKFDVAGQCVDMPNEPDASNFKDKVRIPAYPTYECGGVVWCYMGPAEKQPAPPLFEWTQVPPTHRGMSKVVQECNWLQALEGGIDSSHTNYLHSGLPPGKRHNDNDPMGRARNNSGAVTVEVVPTDYGYSYAGLRDMGNEVTNFVRAYHWIMPWYQIRPGGESSCNGHMWVPMDDENTMVFNLNWTWPEAPARANLPTGELPIYKRDAMEPVGGGNEFVADVDIEHNFYSLRNAENKYLIDRELQRNETYTGITGINVQDRAVQESMGATADRTLERLGTTDRAIINARRTLMKAIKIVQDGGDPPGVAPTYYKLRSIQHVLPKEAVWFEALKAELFQLDEPKSVAST
jgi:nitrite reductase/ring-hydroxylating ferredoxin subunit